MSDTTDKASAPGAWIGREVNVRYADADVPRWLDCTLEEAGAWGVTVSTDEKTSFFPWDSVIKIDLGHGQPARGLGQRLGRR